MLDLTVTMTVLALALALVLALSVGGLSGYLLRGRLDVRRRARRQKRLAEVRDEALWERKPFRNTARPASIPLSGGAKPDPDPAGAGSRIPPRRSAGSTESGDAPTVLVVDDRLELLALHASYLERAGYRVLTAEDGEAALAVARRDHPAVVVLDHSMPKLTGIEVARELKRDAATSDIAILLMTAHSYGAIGSSAMKAGCDAFLPKPCDPVRVLREVSRHAPRAGWAGV